LAVIQATNAALLESGGPSAARDAAGVEATAAAAAPSRNSRLSIKAPSIDRPGDSGGV
jgi:hypothetical protein